MNNRFLTTLIMACGLWMGGATAASTTPVATQDAQWVANFLAVMIQWPSTDHDVYLQVEDPGGALFSFAHRKVAGRPGELSIDTTNRPGLELWESAPAPPGTYKICYKFYARHGNAKPVTVSGVVYSRQGRLPLPTLSLDRVGDRRLAATLVVAEGGSVSIQ